jgi:hypothetical protein
MITVTPRQLLCHTTDIVTGWINGFHFWDAAGNILSPHPLQASSSTNNETVRLDNVSYAWRRTSDLPTAYSEIRACISMDSPWAAHDKTTVGIMAKSIQKVYGGL